MANNHTCTQCSTCSGFRSASRGGRFCSRCLHSIERHTGAEAAQHELAPDDVKSIKETIHRVSGSVVTEKPFTKNKLPSVHPYPLSDPDKLCPPMLAERISHFSDMASKNVPNKQEKNGAITLPLRLNRLHSYPQPTRVVSEKDPVIEDLKKVSIKDRIAKYTSAAHKANSPLPKPAADVGRRSKTPKSPATSEPVVEEEVVREDQDDHTRRKHEKEMRRHKYADVSPKLSLQSQSDIFVGKLVGLDDASSVGSVAAVAPPQVETSNRSVDVSVFAEEPARHGAGTHCELPNDAEEAVVLASAECPSRLDDISLDTEYMMFAAPSSRAVQDASEMPATTSMTEDRCRLAGHVI